MGDSTTYWVILLSFVILLTFVLLLFIFWFGWWISQRSQGTSPYTGVPLRRATELPYYSAPVEYEIKKVISTLNPSIGIAYRF